MHSISLKKVELDAQGSHLLVECSIQPHIPSAYLILDTGASKSVFDPSYLQEQEYTHIETEHIESSQLTEMISGTIISIHSFCIAGNEYSNFEALAMSLAHVNSIYGQYISHPIVGLLGGDFLSKHQAVISYKQLQLKIY